MAAAWKVLDYLLLYYFRFHSAKNTAKGKGEDLVFGSLLRSH